MQTISKGPVKITKAIVEAEWRRRQQRTRTIIRDKDCRGLALIVNATKMAWSYSYRPRGINPMTGRRWPNKALTLGNPTSHSPDDARIKANQIKGQTSSGGDPVAERKAEAEEKRRKLANTLGRLAALYADVMPTRQKVRGGGHPSSRYVNEELSQLRLALADVNAEQMPAHDFGVADVRRLLIRGRNVRSRFGALSRFLDWCDEAGHIAANPCNLVARARRPKAPQPRAHFLTLGELARLWHAAGTLAEPVWRDFVRFLIAIPCRRGEAARLDWSHLDPTSREWRQPGHLTKNRTPHRLHLHPLAVEVLRERRRLARESNTMAQPQGHNIVWPSSGLVFPAPVCGGVLSTFTAIKTNLAKAAGRQQREGDAAPRSTIGWTFHDFRRSFASALGEADLPEAVADLVLNHRQAASRSGVLGVYQQSVRWPAQVRAMELWGRLLAAAIEEEASPEVLRSYAG
jgi:integrase